MKTVRFAILLAIISVFSSMPSPGQDNGPSRMLILPFQSNGVDSVTCETAESILRTEIGKTSPMDIISARRTRDALGDSRCSDQDCAIALGKKLGATQVIGCQLSALGEKIIVQYFLMDVDSAKRLMIDQMTASDAADLEPLMKRLAKSAVTLRPIEKTTEVGSVLAEESKEPLRRASNKNFGIAFGYLYPEGGYDNSDRSFVVDARFDYEMENFAAGMMMGVRHGFATNLYGSILLSRTDICPFLTGAFGFHWVSHDDGGGVAPAGTTQPEKRGDGFEVSAQTGLRLLRTYNFQLMLNLEYILTFNDYNDRAIVFTIGLL